MPTETILLVFIILAGFYMAWNIGANDVANAMGTSVGSGALTLRQAVVIAAILEFCGAFFFGSHVSDTIQNGIVDSEIFTHRPMILVYGMLASLLSAGTWLQIASYYGLPVSTTHTIVGAVVGFGAIIGGWNAIYWKNVFFIVTSWVLSPLLGGILSYFIFSLLRKQIFYRHNPVEETKKLLPFLILIVATTLALILIFDGLHNVNVELTFFQSIALSLAFGITISGISFFLVRFITVPQRSKTSANPPELLLAISKAKNHLNKAKVFTRGETEYQISNLLENVETLESHLNHSHDQDMTRQDYAKVEKIFAYLQIASACLMAFAHGANDVANAIGPLAAAVDVLQTNQISTQNAVPVWALALGGFGIVIGLATWGWRVIETIGKKITELTPTRGFAAEFGTATTILLASRLGLPISTTHTLVGAVIGVGLARGIEALDLSMTRDIVLSWVITVPAGAFISVFFFYLIQAAFG